MNKENQNQEETDTTTQGESINNSISQEQFGTLSEGEKIDAYTFTNSKGMKMKVITYGAIITHLEVPDKDGNVEDVVLGYDNLEGYLNTATPYFGAIVGRYGNRIANGKFTLNGEEYKLATNNGPNHLHGGLKGFDKVVWSVEDTFNNEEGAGLKLKYVSPDGEEGYPGTLTTFVTYTLTDEGVKIAYEATTDKPTVVNLTNHTYFNLSGGEGDILDHVVSINADRFVPVNENLIPTGELKPVEGTPFDFTSPKRVGEEINAENQQIKYGKGYDHTWVLNGEGMKKAATVHHPESGRYMEVFTEEPGVQFYTGNFLDGSLTGKGGNVYELRDGLCLETQHFPDSPNQKDFPSVVLNPGETYSTQTTYNFSVK